MRRKYPWTFCNEWDGREWIPDDTIPGKNGWHEDVPKRIYIGTPWIFVTICRSFADSVSLKIPFGRHTKIPTLLSISWRKPDVPRAPRRGQVEMIAKALDVHSDTFDNFIDYHEYGLALIEAVALFTRAQRNKKHFTMESGVRDEIESIVYARRSELTRRQRWRIQGLMRGMGVHMHLRHPLEIPDPPVDADAEAAEYYADENNRQPAGPAHQARSDGDVS